MTTDYKKIALRLASVLEEFILHHADGEDLPETTLRDAVNAIQAYNDAAYGKVSLKLLVKLAYEQAILENRDPWAAILETIAAKTEDCYDHLSDEQELKDDIKDWLICESRHSIQ